MSKSQYRSAPQSKVSAEISNNKSGRKTRRRAVQAAREERNRERIYTAASLNGVRFSTKTARRKFLDEVQANEKAAAKRERMRQEMMDAELRGDATGTPIAVVESVLTPVQEPTVTEWATYTKAELVKFLAERNITANARMTRAQLIGLLNSEE